jgi:DMSO/TMAO reductase YedYZ molybdopterin-dependent catalytic subunit
MEVPMIVEQAPPVRKQTSRRLSGPTTVQALALGALAGLFAALAMTLLMGATRLLLGIPTPAEMLGDVFIPTLNLDQFFMLIGRFGGGSGIKQVGIGSVLLGQVVAGLVVGAIYGALAARDGGQGKRAPRFIIAAGLVAWLATTLPLYMVLNTNYRGLPAGPATVLTVVGLFLTYAFFAFVITVAYRLLTARPATALADVPSAPAGLGRRALIGGGATIVAAAATGGMLRYFHGISTLGYDGTRYRGPDVQAITPNDRFYTVTKNILDPDVARAVWRLQVDGLVATARTFTFEELAALSAVTIQEATVSCISNDVGDGLASNAVWRGIPLRALLAEVGAAGTFAKVVLHGTDNYVDTILPDKALESTTFVAWEMNGAPLSPRHGYPVRLVVPGRFGEKSVKWLTRIEVVAQDEKGFYERQGWGPTFTPEPFSRFDAPSDRQPLSAGVAIQLHGIAFGGDRGISRVEISTDDGHTWKDARLDYQKSGVVWTLWSLDWQPTGAGEYRLAVRAVDGNGVYQTSDTRGIAPDGATGYHRITVQVNG